MSNVLRRLWARNRTFLLAMGLVLGWFQFLIGALVSEVDMQAAIGQFLAFVPPVMRAAMEQTLLSGTTAGVLAFGWNHPITHVVITAVAIALGARAVAGEVESGAAELVLAQPLSRAAYLTAHVVFGLAALVLVGLAGVAGTVISQRVFGIPGFGAFRLSALLLNLVVLQAAFFGATLLVSTWGRELGAVTVAGVLAAVVSYFVDVLATLWPRASFLAHWSLHGYYDPRAVLVRGELEPAAVLVPGAVLALLVALAYWHFQRRDLP